MERYDDGFAEERQRIERLVEEIIAGEHKIDKTAEFFRRILVELHRQNIFQRQDII